MQKNLAILFAVAVLAVGFATPAYAAPKDACTPWPACKDDPQGEGESTCNTEYLGILGETVGGEAEGPCTDMQGHSCDLVRPNDTGPGWHFTENCQTSETLFIDPDDIINGEDYILKLVWPWDGDRAAITNRGGRAAVQDLNILVADQNVADGSCDGRPYLVEAAISFDTLGVTSSVPGLIVTNVVVTAEVDSGAQFCNAIEYVSKDAERALPFFPGRVRDSEIGPDSYSNFGILVTNINTSDDINKAGDGGDVGILRNVVHYSANGCVGIQVGPWVERANIQDNDVDAPGCGGLGGVGISVLKTGVAIVPDGDPNNTDDIPPTDAFLAPRPANIVGNIVNIGDSLDFGISIVDSAIDKNQGNAIIGVELDQCYFVDNSVGVSFPTKGKKKNTFNGELITNSITCP